MFGDHAQPHVLHHRQRVGQRDVVADAIELEAQTAVLIAAQTQTQIVLRGERSDLFDIVRSHRRGHFFDVARRQRAPIAAGERQPALFAVAGDQLVAQIVLPVTHDRGEFDVYLHRVDLHDFAFARTHQHVQLRQRRIAELDRGVHPIRVQHILEHRFDAQTDFGVVTIARNIGQYRVEAAVAVVTQEQTAAHALLQTQNTGRQLIQLGLCRLEQFVARQFFQNMAQRFAAVPGRMQAGGLHHVFVTFAHQRDFPRPARVGAGGVQTDETLLGDGATVGVETEHADVVHIARAVHGCAGVCFGQDQGIRGARMRHVVRG